MSPGSEAFHQHISMGCYILINLPRDSEVGVLMRAIEFKVTYFFVSFAIKAPLSCPCPFANWICNGVHGGCEVGLMSTSKP